MQQKIDGLVSAVSEAVHVLTPRAKPSPHAKRWWTADLTQLHQIYTYWRNYVRLELWAGQKILQLEDIVANAAKQYYNAIRKQEMKYWNEFLADNDDIWKTAEFLKLEDTVFGKILQFL